MKDLIDKVKKIQQTVVDKRDEASQKKVEVSVGGGTVELVMNGNLEILSIKLDPEIVDKDEIETLEDLIRAALNEGVRQAKDLLSFGMNDLMKEFNISDLSDMISKK